jgi:ABC-type transport system involved in multi-copper enzyme maturation permease subunit
LGECCFNTGGFGVLGEALDGWGDGLSGLLMLLGGTLLSLVLLIVLSVVYRSGFQRRGVSVSPWLVAVVLGGLGIFVGSMMSLLVLLNNTDQPDECNFLDAQSRRNMYSPKEQAEKRKLFESKNCPAILKAYERQPQAIKNLYIFAGLLSPTLGLLTGFFGTLTLARLRRRSRL